MIGINVGISVGQSVGIATGINNGGASLNLTGRDLILYSGQSQVVGEAYAARCNLADINRTFGAVYQFDKLARDNTNPIVWDSGIRGPVLLSPRTAAGTTSVGDFSFPLAAGPDLDHAFPNRWVIASFAVGATKMNTEWLVGGTYPTLPGGGPTLVNQVVPYIQSIEALGCTLRCIVWDQGTSDALVHAAALSYQTNLQTFYNLIRASYPTVPWVIHHICSTSAGGADLTLVRDAEVNFVAANPGSMLVDSESPLMPGPGTEHYVADGLLVVGQRSAVAVLTAMGLQGKPFAEFRSAGNTTTIAFSDLSRASNGTINAWAWTFGDAGTASTQNPTHVYAAPGTYTVTLTITDTNGKTDAISHSVIVVSAATWTIDATRLVACPANATEGAALLAAAMPSSSTSGNFASLWTMQQTVSPMTDAIATRNLALAGSPTPNTTVASYTRKALLFGNGITNQRASSAIGPNPSTTSVLLWAYVIGSATPGAADEDMMSMGNGAGEQLTLRFANTAGNGRLRITAVASSYTAYSYTSIDGFIILQCDLTLRVQTVYTEAERYILPYEQPASNTLLAIGGTAPGAAFTWMGLMTGAAAEKPVGEVRAMVRAAGWNPAW